MRYIAYGSNLSEEQMAKRCPDARIVGKGYLQGWKLVFRYHATIERAKNHQVPVLVWEISEKDERSLDQYEGFPLYYDKRIVFGYVTDMNKRHRRKVDGMVYIMQDGKPAKAPSKEYYKTIYEGYQRFGFQTDELVRAYGEAMLDEIKSSFSY